MVTRQSATFLGATNIGLNIEHKALNKFSHRSLEYCEIQRQISGILENAFSTLDLPEVSLLGAPSPEGQSPDEPLLPEKPFQEAQGEEYSPEEPNEVTLAASDRSTEMDGGSGKPLNNLEELRDDKTQLNGQGSGQDIDWQQADLDMDNPVAKTIAGDFSKTKDSLLDAFTVEGIPPDYPGKKPSARKVHETPSSKVNKVFLEPQPRTEENDFSEASTISQLREEPVLARLLSVYFTLDGT